MANWYINPGLGSGTNAGTSWANAFNSTTTAWTDAITASSAGDDFYINSASTLSIAGAQTLTFKGTNASPNRIFSCSTITNNPPVAADLGVGATVTTTGANAISINGTAYIFGVIFNSGTGTTGTNFNIPLSGSCDLTFEQCQLNILTTSQTATLTLLNLNAVCRLILINTTVKITSGTASTISVGSGLFIWKNTASAIATGSTAMTSLFNANTRTTIAILDGVDFAGGAGVGSGKNLVAAMPTSSTFQFVNCKLASGVLFATPSVTGATADVVISDSSATGYRQERYTYQGTLTTSTSVYNNATDGTTPISWQVVTTANAKRQSPFECFQIVQWAAAGTYAASLVQCTSATASLTNADIWVDVEYLGSASSPLASLATTAPATQLTAGSSLAAGSWAVGGLGHNYQLAIPSFTTNLAGYVRFTVKVAKASLTINVDPSVTIA